MNQQELLHELIEFEHDHGIVMTLHRYYGSNIRIRIGYPGTMCRASIDDLQLSVRSWNALKRSNISTIGELIDLITDGRLYSIRNLGKISISEIKTKLMVMGFEALTEKKKVQFFEFLIENNSLSH